MAWKGNQGESLVWDMVRQGWLADPREEMISENNGPGRQ